MEQKDYLRQITIRDLWDLLIQRFVVIILAAAIAVSGLFLVDRVTYEPRYEATATLYILRQSNESTSSGDASNDFSLALKVVNDCTYLLKGHTVLDAVIEELELDMSYKGLYNAVSTANPENTRILEVTVQAETPELAKQIVDRICELGKDWITDSMGFEQVNLIERGIMNPEPCNRTSVITFALTGILAGGLTYLVCLVLYLLDDSLRSNDQFEQLLGLSVLGEIPDAKEVAKHNSGYYAYGHGPKKTVRRKK